MSQIEITDKRPMPGPRGIPWHEAEAGQLYQTIGGQQDYIVMAVSVPAADYRGLYPTGLAFVNSTGRAFPRVTERLIPLHADIEWMVYGTAED